MSNIDVERYLEGAFVESLMAIYRYDNSFAYDDDDTLTKVIISSSYPSKDNSFKIPQIVVIGVAYEFNTSSLSNNFACDIIEATTGIRTGVQYISEVPYSVNIACIGQNDAISKSLASSVINYINFEAREVFEDVFKLQIQSVRKSSGGIDKHLGENAFSNSISISGMLIWQGIKSFANKPLLDNIKISLKEKISEV